MLCTRPNISFALRVMSIYRLDLSGSHRVAMKNILKYLTKDVLLINGNGDLIVRYKLLIKLRLLQISIKLNVHMEWWRSQLEEFQKEDDYGFYN